LVGTRKAIYKEGRKIQKQEFFELFTPVWNKCSTTEILCQSGFRATGMFPVNKNAIPEVAYAPSATTERPLLYTVVEDVSLRNAIPEVVYAPNDATGRPPLLNTVVEDVSLTFVASGAATLAATCTGDTLAARRARPVPDPVEEDRDSAPYLNAIGTRNLCITGY
jgi:hypothetical protein